MIIVLARTKKHGRGSKQSVKRVKKILKKYFKKIKKGPLGNYTTKPGAEYGEAGGATDDWYISTGAKYR